MFFALYGTWGPLVVGKILLRSVGTICPPGEYHSGRQNMNFCYAVRAMPGTLKLNLATLGHTLQPGNACRQEEKYIYIGFQQFIKLLI